MSTMRCCERSESRVHSLIMHVTFGYTLQNPQLHPLPFKILSHGATWKIKRHYSFSFTSLLGKNYQILCIKVILYFRTLNIHVAALNKLRSNKLTIRGSVRHHHINRAWGFVCFFLLQWDQAIVVFQDKGYSVYITQWFMDKHIHEQEFISLIQDCHKQCLHFI